MNSIEEQVWSYIDGTCTPEEHMEIEIKIQTVLQYKQVYEQLLDLDAQLQVLDFEEPSMSFTRNVMQQVNNELKPVALKTKVDNRIVYGIAAFFAISMVALLGYAISISHFSTGSFSLPTYSFSFDKLFTPLTIRAFLFADIALALLFTDYLMRNRNHRTTKKGT